MKINRWVQMTKIAGWVYLVVVAGLFILTGLLVLTSAAAPGGDSSGARREFGYFGMGVLSVPLLLGILGAVLLAVRRWKPAFGVVLVQGLATAALWGFGVATSLGDGGTVSNLIVSIVCLVISVAVAVCAVQALRTGRLDAIVRPSGREKRTDAGSTTSR